MPAIHESYSSHANKSQRLSSALQPSFNGALASDPSLPASSAQFHCVMNTVLSLIGACLSAFALSAAYHGKLDMVHIQNSTLAGGVAIGSAANMNMAPAAALGVGMVAGAISVLGFRWGDDLAAGAGPGPIPPKIMLWCWWSAGHHTGS